MAAPPKDPTNPLFLHHSDGPGLTLTSQPLDHKNNTTWSRAMLVALSVKNKVAFIDGSLPKPPATDPTSSCY
ncbi:Gag-polypeptide of LTR copia-type [Sesbania bispinosa]|nr:Gag-polypeptide of LTR copia-type [Sesbania bispinosa]